MFLTCSIILNVYDDDDDDANADDDNNAAATITTTTTSLSNIWAVQMWSPHALQIS